MWDFSDLSLLWNESYLKYGCSLKVCRFCNNCYYLAENRYRNFFLHKFYTLIGEKAREPVSYNILIPRNIESKFSKYWTPILDTKPLVQYMPQYTEHASGSHFLLDRGFKRLWLWYIDTPLPPISNCQWGGV